MYSRRDFLKTAAALGSSSVAWGTLPDVISRAMEIDPAVGSTFMDAEHVVILMQENRSFDHAFGALRGVRGFRDPRPFELPSGDPVWFQADTDGSIVPPFRMDMDGSNVTWIGGTPHSWPDQVDARNNGRYDKWLPAKRRGDKFPMTMGFFSREDIPFYYALADAFTICDYAFCSSLTGTTPNRLHLWTGTIRESADHPARVQNGDTDYGREVAWTTFPERLEKAGVSWKIYQNEISLDSGFTGEQDAWLANFTDNPIEWFSQYRVRFSPARRAHVAKRISELEAAIPVLKDKDLEKAKVDLKSLTAERELYNDQTWAKLSKEEKALHEKAFCSNRIDKNYRELVKHSYEDKGTKREINVPKGDALAQFRADVKSGQLPKVSWLVASERFSDHPGSAWFGAWYLSEALNILTADPEVWKKTIFILCYDENDGFFDHVPPFIAPHPDRPETGKVSKGIDTRAEISKEHGRDHSIGLGYRCPLLIASPWTRGGSVNSQICDHTSILMFLETWLGGKGIRVKETNISSWRRAVCGDLTSCFKPYNGEKINLPKYLERDSYIERIHKASFKNRPTPSATIGKAEVERFDVRAFQEAGTRPSCPLPYEIEASIELKGKSAEIVLTTGKKRFGAKSATGAFNFCSYSPDFVSRAYAVSPGDSLVDQVPVGSTVHVRIDGPNGFLRELRSDLTPGFSASASCRGTEVTLTFENRSANALELKISDPSYGHSVSPINLKSGEKKSVKISVKASQRWYDFVVTGGSTAYRFAGRIEDGSWSISDPAMI